MLTGLLFRGSLQTIPNNAMSDRQSTHTLRFYNAIFLVRIFCHREPFNICALSTVWENDGQTNHSLNSKKKERNVPVLVWMQLCVFHCLWKVPCLLIVGVWGVGDIRNVSHRNSDSLISVCHQNHFH